MESITLSQYKLLCLLLFFLSFYLCLFKFNFKTKVRKREEIINKESFFGGGEGGDISITCVTVVSGEGVYLLILFLHIFISDSRIPKTKS